MNTRESSLIFIGNKQLQWWRLWAFDISVAYWRWLRRTSFWSLRPLTAHPAVIIRCRQHQRMHWDERMTHFHTILLLLQSWRRPSLPDCCSHNPISHTFLSSSFALLFIVIPGSCQSFDARRGGPPPAWPLGRQTPPPEAGPVHWHHQQPCLPHSFLESRAFSWANADVITLLG